MKWWPECRWRWQGRCDMITIAMRGDKKRKRTCRQQKCIGHPDWQLDWCLGVWGRGGLDVWNLFALERKVTSMLPDKISLGPPLCVQPCIPDLLPKNFSIWFDSPCGFWICWPGFDESTFIHCRYLGVPVWYCVKCYKAQDNLTRL